MFQMLPIEIEYMIYKIYFSKYVLNEIEWQGVNLGTAVTRTLFNYQGNGRIQAKHTGFREAF